MTVIPILTGILSTVTIVFLQGLEELELRGLVENSIVEISQNSKKSPGDSRRVAVT